MIADDSCLSFSLSPFPECSEAVLGEGRFLIAYWSSFILFVFER